MRNSLTPDRQPEILHKTSLALLKAGRSGWFGQFVGQLAVRPGAIPNETYLLKRQKTTTVCPNSGIVTEALY